MPDSPKPKSKRKSTQERCEVIGAFGFAVVAVSAVTNPIAGGIVAGAYTLLVGLLGFTGRSYSDNETARPSGTLPSPGEVER